MDPVARPASGPEDVLAGLAVRHEAYGRTIPLAGYRAQRLASRREHRAVPWVLDRGDGTVVATLLCHPIDLALDGRVFPAYGLGSVGTRIAERRHGYAATLCRAACEASERAGRSVGLLFSAIPPAYYERLSFRVSPAWNQRCDRLKDLAESGQAAPLTPLDPRREMDRLVSAYAAFHRGTLHPHRDASRFLRSVEDSADDWFFGIRGGEGGYVRLYAEDAVFLDVAESVLLDPADEAPVLRAIARLALEAGRKSVSGWLDPSPAVREHFASGSRATDLPMLRGAPPHASARFWAPDHF